MDNKLDNQSRDREIDPPFLQSFGRDFIPWFLLSTELLLGIFKKGQTPPLCSEKGATVFCHRAIQWFHRNCLIFFIKKINQIKPNFDKRMTIMIDCFKMTFVSAVFMAVLISLVFKKLILVIVKVNNSHKINKTVSCLAKTQPQPFLSNGILMILCVNVPIYSAYSIIRHAIAFVLCFMAKHAIVRFFRNGHFSLHFSS